MTRGYPDFTRLDTVGDDAVVLTGNYTSGDFTATMEVSRFQALNVMAGNFTAVPVRVLIEWAADAAFTVLPVAQWIDLGPTLETSLVYVNRGNYVRAQILFTGGGQQNVGLALTPTNRVSQPVMMLDSTVLMAAGAFSLAGGAGTTLSANSFYTGDADLTYDTDAAAFTVIANALDYAGTTYRLRRLTQANGNPYQGRMFVPPARLRISVTNNDGVLRNFNLSMIQQTLRS